MNGNRRPSGWELLAGDRAADVYAARVRWQRMSVETAASPRPLISVANARRVHRSMLHVRQRIAVVIRARRVGAARGGGATAGADAITS